jgi:hypothetical protein
MAPNKKIKISAGKKSSLVAVRPDVAIPMAFPDYLIETPLGKMGGLGHAGILLIRGKDGTTKYYEYGRYDTKNLGLVRQRSVPDVAIGEGGRPTADSLKKTLAAVSSAAGHGGRLEAVYIEAPCKFGAMVEYAEGRKRQNSNPKRTPYGITDNNCMTFAKDTTAAGGVDMPWMVDPRPNGYIEKLRGSFRKLDYDPRKGALTLDPPR